MASTTRLTRVIASSTRLARQWRHFCTEASPSPPSTPIATPTPTPTPFTAPTFKPPKRRTRKSSRSGLGLDVSSSRRPIRLSTHGMWDSSELQQMDEFERKSKIFFQRKRTFKEMRKFFEEEYDKMERNETKYPGEVTKIPMGNLKGLRLYKPALEVIPTSLPKNDRSLPEWEEIFKKNREMWFKEGFFDIIFEGNVFELGICINERCLDLTECAALGIHYRKEEPIKF